MKREIIVAKNKEHLRELILQDIYLYGNDCDLNYIDVSQITDISGIFNHSEFKGDLENWQPYNLQSSIALSNSSVFSMPYWGGLHTNTEIKQTISAIKQKKELEQELNITTIGKSTNKVKL